MDDHRPFLIFTTALMEADAKIWSLRFQRFRKTNHRSMIGVFEETFSLDVNIMPKVLTIA